MEQSELKLITEELLSQLNQRVINLGRMGRFDAQAVKDSYSTIINTVTLIEVYADNLEEFQGEQKRTVAVDMLNSVINIPFIPEFVEASLIGWSIDLAIELFNKVGGQKWLDVFFGDDDPEVEE